MKTKSTESTVKLTVDDLKDIVTPLTDAIQTELVRRGFHAPIQLTLKEDRYGMPTFDLSSEPFQTMPVLFKTIRISDFGCWVEEDFDNPGLIKIAISVHASYEHFGGGSNGVDLFRFRCTVRRAGDRVFDVRVGY